jgi:DNA-binding MurR/RpiR family transcriptional regulator
LLAAGSRGLLRYDGSVAVLAGRARQLHEKEHVIYRSVLGDDRPDAGYLAAQPLATPCGSSESSVWR